MKIHCRWLLSCAAIALSTLTIQTVKAVPYACEVTNNNGTVQFYLNESNANITVTYGDGTTNVNFWPATGTGTNLPAGEYSFSMGSETSYSISVYKLGTGVPSLLKFIGTGSANPRGVGVNKNPTSPYCGRVYLVDGSAATSGCFMLNPDMSFIGSSSTPYTAGVTTWDAAGSAAGSSPDYVWVGPDDGVLVSDGSTNGSSIYKVDPTFSTAQLLLGPVGDPAGLQAGVHGTIESDAVTTGSLAGGNLVLYDVDGELGPPYNCVQVYKIGSGPLPWESPTNYSGPSIDEPTLDSLALGGNEYGALTIGSSGYLYVSTYRNDLTAPNFQIYDSTGVTNLWNSWLPAGTPYPGGSPTSDICTNTAQGLASSQISADGKYFVGLQYYGNVIIMPLTNGIPNVAGYYVAPAAPLYGYHARGIAFDVADNFYISNSGGGWLEEWSLGLTATCVTSGNLSGVTGFQEVFPPTVISVSTTNSIIAQANSDGLSTNTTFAITRAGSLSGSLTVGFTLSGTALGGSGYPASVALGSTSSVVFAPGQASTNISVRAVLDSIPRPTSSLTLTLSSSGVYSLGSPSTASVTIENTAPDELFASVGVPSMYKAFSNDYATITITRWGDTNAEVGPVTLTGSSFVLSGTAVEGTDYTPPTSVTFNPGDLTQSSTIYPLINGQLPMDSTNVPYTGNKTIIASIGSGSGYSGSTNTAVLTLIDNANPPATYLYVDPLNQSADSNNWEETSANDNMQTNAIDSSAVFGYDLFDDPLDPVSLTGQGVTPLPFPPSGSTNALRVTVNKEYSEYNTSGGNPVGNGTGAAGAVNLFLTNAFFSGNYAVRFNMNLVEGYNSQYTTEGALFGFNHSGNSTNWWSGSNVRSGWGANNTEAWASDGIWTWVSVDDGVGAFDNGPADYVVLTGNGGALPNSGFSLPPIAAMSKASLANALKSTVFTSPQGPGLAANESPDEASNPLQNDSSWADVELKQFNNVVTISIDKTPICVYTNVTAFTNGYVMLGYEDPYDSVGGGDAAVYYSNLRVVRLAPPLVSETAVSAGNYVFDFTSTDGDASPASFLVVGATSLNGPYAVVPGATIIQLGSGAYQATVPTSGPVHFYRIQQNLSNG